MKPRKWVRFLIPDGASGRHRVATHEQVGPAMGRQRQTLLVCFPHSGGWAESFLPWRDHIQALEGDVDPPRVDLLATQYPGHGDRSVERPEGDIRAMARAIREELVALAPVHVLLFGHSFGAMVAYETARQLEHTEMPPAALAVSGARAPSAEPAISPDVAGLPAEQLWQRMTELGGIDPVLAEDLDLRDVLLSTFRADIAAHERYVSAPPAPDGVSVDIRCYLGSDDPLVPDDASEGWAAWTMGRVTKRIRRGGHFHLFENPRDLLADLLDEHVGASSEATA